MKMSGVLGAMGDVLGAIREGGVLGAIRKGGVLAAIRGGSVLGAMGGVFGATWASAN